MSRHATPLSQTKTLMEGKWSAGNSGNVFGYKRDGTFTTWDAQRQRIATGTYRLFVATSPGNLHRKLKDPWKSANSQPPKRMKGIRHLKGPFHLEVRQRVSYHNGQPCILGTIDCPVGLDTGLYLGQIYFSSDGQSYSGQSYIARGEWLAPDRRDAGIWFRRIPSHSRVSKVVSAHHP